jgi:ATP-dependent Lhr-like helicase
VTIQLEEKVAGELLTALEDLELPALQWGVTTGALSAAEVQSVIDEFMLARPEDFPGAEAEDVLECLVKKALLFEVPAESPPRYRTRMAETLRLTARLRQLFPPMPDVRDAPPKWWETGKTLVADYRLHIEPRRYPIRDVPVETVLAELEGLPGWTAAHRDVLAAQVAGRPLARFQMDATASIFRSLGG